MKWIGAAMLALALGGCDAAQDFTSPGSETSLEAQRFAEFERSVLDAARAAGIPTEIGPAVELSFSLTDDSSEWVVVEGQVGDESVEAVIGAAGGELRLGRHWLLVPAGTVLSSTRFVMTPVQDGTMHVELTATTVSLGEVEENDVGSAGFRQPVYLSFSVDAGSFDPMSAAVAWLHDDGMQVQPSFVYQDDSVVGALTHFSGYVLVAN